MSTPVEIQSVEQWNDIVQASTEAGKTIVVDFHAEWCGPCKAIAPRYNLLASKTPQVQFLQVSAMPTFFAIKSNAVVGMGLTRLVQKHAGPNPPIGARIAGRRGRFREVVSVASD
ncbi:thioredoxin-like protein [Mycena maculata]|uniref:Thioredoxin-like protein n=1 Tax=Mycena maculata TaxID=230809 RepID=A0AAD7HYB3_9AGAR|nr:thioredoxin-like protein [Mycena maculata]